MKDILVKPDKQHKETLVYTFFSSVKGNNNREAKNNNYNNNDAEKM